MIIVSDVVRVINVGLYAATVVAILWVVLTYYQIWIRERNSWVGLLPRHVYLIGISYIMYATGSVGVSFQNFGRPITPFTLLNAMAGAIGFRAVLCMIRYQSKRMLP